ncbi:MAG: SIMPL domain-containing protein [Saprospiraceae bacterium]|nr:SIMPL domain-containing protein [Saprospiraceae bacterium]
MKTNYMPASVILGIFFVLGMYIFGRYILETRKSAQYVSVKGLAEKEVQADQGSWILAVSSAGNDIEYLKRDINLQLKNSRDWLQEKGFAESEIKVEELSIRENIYGEAQARYSANLQISVSTDKVDILDQVSGQVNQLLDEGVSLTGDRWLTRPRYFFTKINDIKPELLAESTQAALKSAEEFATNSGAEVGGIRRANQGIISMIPSNRVNESEEFYLNKIARVVSSIDYYIK